MRRESAVPIVALFLILSAGAPAQESASLRVTESVLNAGGHPTGGSHAAGATLQISLSSVGGALNPATLASRNTMLAAGFVAAFAPPVEVAGVRFIDEDHLLWDPQPAATYNVYRGDLPALHLGPAAACLQAGVGQTTATDNEPIPAGSVRFYLVTAENGLHEEGSAGAASDGALRQPAAACP